MQRRDFLRLAASATGTAVLGGMLGSHSAKAAAVKPQKLNLLKYATAETDSEAVNLTSIKLQDPLSRALPTFRTYRTERGLRLQPCWAVGSNGTEKAVKRRPQPEYAAGAARL